VGERLERHGDATFDGDAQLLQLLDVVATADYKSKP